MQAHATPLFPAYDPKSGVLAADGYGVKVFVRRGHLVVEDGIGEQRRQTILHRATGKLRRLVILGDEGFITFEAQRWLADTGAALLHIDRSDRVLTTSAVQGVDFPALRRAQARAASNDVGLSVTQYLLDEKLSGQTAVLARIPGSGDAVETIGMLRKELAAADSQERLRLVESAAAAEYWGAWRKVSARFVSVDESKVPEHWRSFGRRASALTGNPRVATNPANAILNYCFALLEAECRIACAAVGLDPGIGVLHADQRNRDSLALDLMEAVRPGVEGFVLQMLGRQTLRSKDFTETRQGSCRILAPLTHYLAALTVGWSTTIGPIAEQVARILLQDAGAASAFPTRLTQDNRSRGRDGIRQGKRRVRTARAAALPPTCRGCGLLLEDPGARILCELCLAEARTAAGARFSASGPAALAKLRSEGRDPAHGGTARAKRAASFARNQAGIKAFEEAATRGSDPETYREHIWPRIKDLTLKELTQATGLTEGYMSMVRRGRVPHVMHWAALSALADQHREQRSQEVESWDEKNLPASAVTAE
jgi:CRISPR-associated endonuclease Cas1